MHEKGGGGRACKFHRTNNSNNNCVNGSNNVELVNLAINYESSQFRSSTNSVIY